MVVPHLFYAKKRENSEIVTEKNVDFDYKLKARKLRNRNAIRMLKINDYPDNLINETIEVSKKLDSVRK